MTIANTIEEFVKSYEKEYQTPILNVVTDVMDETSDKCDGRKRMTNVKTVMKYYSVKPKEFYSERQYEEHNSKTYQKYVMTIKPRKFYSKAQVMAYVSYLNRTAGRTIEDDEMNLLLRTITRGRQYDLVCVIDRTEELKEVTKWVR